ncbi:hypothetical protein P7K49_027598 [Saguinus oedipus]|uniref:Uncharacterized protein n=1 Tax=Saguinus oedipus TaxID=9490 RepID=A0ABQ9UA30_SAGOE|nr:hypothetical protein P7K49_027598 [Saguinus oedipus]
MVMIEWDRNVFVEWHPGHGIYCPSTRTPGHKVNLRDSQNQKLVMPPPAWLPLPSSVSLAHRFTFEPGPSSLSPLPELPAASPSWAASPASPAPLAAAALWPPASRAPGIAQQDAEGRRSQAAWRSQEWRGSWLSSGAATARAMDCGKGVGKKRQRPGSSETPVLAAG